MQSTSIVIIGMRKRLSIYIFRRQRWRCCIISVTNWSEFKRCGVTLNIQSNVYILRNDQAVKEMESNRIQNQRQKIKVSILFQCQNKDS